MSVGGGLLNVSMRFVDKDGRTQFDDVAGECSQVLGVVRLPLTWNLMQLRKEAPLIRVTPLSQSAGDEYRPNYVTYTLCSEEGVWVYKENA